MNTAIIVAAGKSERMGGKADKAFLSLGPKPVLAYSLMLLDAHAGVDDIVLVVRREQQLAAQGLVQMFGCRKVRKIVAGGSTRLASVRNGLAACDPDETRVVLVHDGARPCVTHQIVADCIASAAKNGSGVAATKLVDSVKLVQKGFLVSGSLDRDKVWTVQTPQAFRFDLLQRAIAAVQDKDPRITDEASAVELLGEPVRLVPSATPNPKVTVPEDLVTAARLLGVSV